jgi:RNA polymerase sigma-70 factor (ECF subfamily)
MLNVQSEAAALETALKAARRGDVTAFNQLVLEFQRQVFNVCLRTLGRHDDAADATQDAFLSAFRAIGSFAGPAAGFRAWLLRIAVNTCYDHLRRRQRRPTESLDLLSSGESDQPGRLTDRLADPAIGPEQHSMGAETARTIQQAIDRLSPDQRLTVILCDVQGLSYDEVAAVMGVELGTVKSRLSRARAQLRDTLAAQGELPGSSQRLHQRNP